MAGLRWSPHREISKPARLAQASAACPPAEEPAPTSLPVPEWHSALPLGSDPALADYIGGMLAVYTPPTRNETLTAECGTAGSHVT